MAIRTKGVPQVTRLEGTAPTGTSNLTLAGHLWPASTYELDPHHFAGSYWKRRCGHRRADQRAHGSGADDVADPGRFGRGRAYGARLGAVTLALYALEGAAGLPVFANFQAGMFLPTAKSSQRAAISSASSWPPPLWVTSSKKAGVPMFSSFASPCARCRNRLCSRSDLAGWLACRHEGRGCHIGNSVALTTGLCHSFWATSSRPCWRRLRSRRPSRFWAAAEFKKLVGVRGFEPPPPCSRSRCATRLRYTPTFVQSL